MSFKVVLFFPVESRVVPRRGTELIIPGKLRITRRMNMHDYPIGERLYDKIRIIIDIVMQFIL